VLCEPIYGKHVDYKARTCSTSNPSPSFHFFFSAFYPTRKNQIIPVAVVAVVDSPHITVRGHFGRLLGLGRF
jgi:hypothetical protein